MIEQQIKSKIYDLIKPETDIIKLFNIIPTTGLVPGTYAVTLTANDIVSGKSITKSNTFVLE